MTANHGGQGARDTKLAVAALTGLSLVVGYNWVVMKIGLLYSDPWPFAALRTSLGALALFVVLLVLRRPLRPCRVPLTVLLGLLQTTAMMGLLMWALETGTAGRVSALVYTMPFWSLILGWAVLGERMRRVYWAAGSLALLGLLMLLDPRHLGGSLFSKALAVGSGMSWAMSAIVARFMSRRGPFDVINITAWQMLYGSIPLIVIAVIVPSRPIEWSSEYIYALLYNVIPATAVYWVLWLYIIRRVPAGVAGISTLATPVVGILSAAIQLGERISPIEAAGMGCVLAALLVLIASGIPKNWASYKRKGQALAHENKPMKTSDERSVEKRPKERGKGLRSYCSWQDSKEEHPRC